MLIWTKFNCIDLADLGFCIQMNNILKYHLLQINNFSQPWFIKLYSIHFHYELPLHFYIMSYKVMGCKHVIHDLTWYVLYVSINCVVRVKNCLYSCITLFGGLPKYKKTFKIATLWKCRIVGYRFAFVHYPIALDLCFQ